MKVPSPSRPAHRGQGALFPDAFGAIEPPRAPADGTVRPTRPAVASCEPSAGPRDAARTPPGSPRWAWAGLEELRPDVRAALARHSCRSFELDDVVQESLIRAARYRGSLTDTERLRGWVIRIALNVMRDHMRRDLRLPRVEDGDDVFEGIEGREGIPGEDPDDEPVEAEGFVFERDYVMRHLDLAFHELPRMDQRVLGAWYAEEGDPRATQVRESMSELAKVRAFRARSRLTRLMRRRLALDVVDDDDAEGGESKPGRRGARCAAGTLWTKKERDAARRARS